MSTEDELLEESAAMVQRKFGNMSVSKTERDPAEAGFQMQTQKDSDLDQSWRNHSGAGGAGEVSLEEQASTRRDVLNAKNKIEEIGALSMDDMIDLGIADADPNTRKAAKELGEITRHMVNSGARQVVQNAYIDPNEASDLMEQEAYKPEPTGQAWQVAKKRQKLKSGKVIAVFMVEDSLTEMTTGKKYRLAEVAGKVARVLNATNNPDDPRINMINTAYDKHVALMQNIAKTRRAIKEGQTNKRGRLTVLEHELDVVNAKLGLT